MEEFNPKKKIHRDFLRRSASSNVKVTCHRRGSGETGPNLTSVVLDLSEAGARLIVTAPLEVGEEVVLGLEGPAYETPLTRSGKIVWSFQINAKGFAVGIRLEERFEGDDVEQVTIQPMRLDY
jgi:hypothetical protein